MLCCFASLLLLGMDLVGWHNKYRDVPSKQPKVAVRDKSSVACSPDETPVRPHRAHIIMFCGSGAEGSVTFSSQYRFNN